MSDGLKPTTPAEAVEWYLAEREPELSEKSLQNQRYRLSQFLEFCDDRELDNMNALTGRDIHRYRVARSKDVKTVTLRGELQTFRVFLEFAAAIDAVEPGIRERVQLPEIEPEDEPRDEHLDAARADAILEHLVTSSRGRLSDGSIRETIYRLTQPCEIGDCPHDRDPETCSDRQHGKRAGCPSSRSTHGIRRGSNTDHLRKGTPQEVVSDRSNVSSDVLDQHYDERTDREKMEIRREFLEEA